MSAFIFTFILLYVLPVLLSGSTGLGLAIVTLIIPYKNRLQAIVAPHFFTLPAFLPVLHHRARYPQLSTVDYFTSTTPALYCKVSRKITHTKQYDSLHRRRTIQKHTPTKSKAPRGRTLPTHTAHGQYKRLRHALTHCISRWRYHYQHCTNLILV